MNNIVLLILVAFLTIVSLIIAEKWRKEIKAREILANALKEAWLRDEAYAVKVIQEDVSKRLDSVYTALAGKSKGFPAIQATKLLYAIYRLAEHAGMVAIDKTNELFDSRHLQELQDKEYGEEVPFVRLSTHFMQRSMYLLEITWLGLDMPFAHKVRIRQASREVLKSMNR